MEPVGVNEKAAYFEPFSFSQLDRLFLLQIISDFRQRFRVLNGGVGGVGDGVPAALICLL